MSLEAKTELRVKLKSQLSNIPKENKAALSGSILNHFITSKLWAQTSHIMIFAPLPSEPDLLHLLPLAYQTGKTIYLPRVDGNHLKSYKISDASELKNSTLGVREPDPALHEELNPLAIDIVITPGLAFDHSGMRLGKGAGYYDRFFSESRHPLKIGCFYECQLVESVPAEKHDVAMDYLLSEKGLRKTDCDHHYTSKVPY
ncbi:MAG: 5-formyltetrahydrofolate cyclo-ligase [Verrucomicrobiota bacterium]